MFQYKSDRLYISSDVVFEETIFPFQSHSNSTSSICSPKPIITQPIISFPTPPLAQTQSHPTPNATSSSPHLISHVSHSPPQTTSSLENSSSLIPSSSLSSTNTSSSSPDPPHNHHPMITRAKNHISKPKMFHDGTTRHPIAHALIAVGDFSIIEPTCFS